jgi:hypothetical protein
MSLTQHSLKYLSQNFELLKKVFQYIFRPTWPSSGVITSVTQKLLCSLDLFRVRSHACAGVYLSDGPLTPCCLCVTVLL